jgi:hypothetical protein
MLCTIVCVVNRFYVQLPTEKAHEFHDDSGQPETKKEIFEVEQMAVTLGVNPGEKEPEGVRLHPKVVQKLRSLVASGETRVYVIRRQLRLDIALGFQL